MHQLVIPLRERDEPHVVVVVALDRVSAREVDADPEGEALRRALVVLE